MIYGLFGNVGKFKTALATLIALIYLQAGYDIYTNYTLEFPQFQNLIHKLTLSELLELEVDRGLILIDEVYTIAESRVSTSKLNRFFSYFIFQSRKIKVEILYTSQLTSAVDLRLFNLTDVKIACYGLNKWETHVKFELVYDNNGKEKRHKFQIPLEIFQDYIFNHYDTYQPINPLGIMDLIIDVERFDVEKINTRVDEAIERIFKAGYYPTHKYEVNDACLRLGISQSLASYIFDRIKSNQHTKKNNKTQISTLSFR